MMRVAMIIAALLTSVVVLGISQVSGDLVVEAKPEDRELDFELTAVRDFDGLVRVTLSIPTKSKLAGFSRLRLEVKKDAKIRLSTPLVTDVKEDGTVSATFQMATDLADDCFILLREPAASETSSYTVRLRDHITDRELDGVLYVCGDDAYDLRINGEIIGSGGVEMTTFPLSIGVGDLITVKVTNARYERGFMSFFQSNDKCRAFFTSVATWKCFVPENPNKWWRVRPGKGDSNADSRSKKYPEIPLSRGYGTESIWGLDTSTSFLYHVVSRRDVEDEGPALPGPRRKRAIEL